MERLLVTRISEAKVEATVDQLEKKFALDLKSQEEKLLERLQTAFKRCEEKVENLAGFNNSRNSDLRKEM